MQWNARSAVSNKQSLKQFLVNEDVDIALISETWFKPNKTYSFVGYNIVRQDRYDGITGTAILIKREYQFVEIDIDQNAINSDISLCAIKLKLPNDNNLTLASLYKSPQIVTTSQDWKNCFDLFSEPCIIGGDFNGHHLCWGSTRNDETGQQLVGAIDESNLIVLNTGQATRMGGPTQQKSVVDITLCSPNIACKLTWQVIADTLGSDHYPIVISMGDTSEMVIKPKSKWNIKFAKWDLYQSISETLFESIPQNFENIENKYSWFINNINVAAEASIPEKKPFKIKARPPPPWWDLECARALNERREALETYKAMGTLENYINCRRILAKTKKIFNRKARNKWKSWISGLNKDTSNKQLWRQAKIIQRINDNSNFNACSDFSWEEDMLHKLAPPYVTNFKNTDITTTNQYNNLLEQRFTLTELDWAIKKSTCTAPGFDQITYSMLDNLPNKALRYCIGAMPSTPIVPLQVEAATPPLNLRRQILARKFIVKGIAKHYTNICNIRKLSTLDLISPYWIHKNSPPLCDAFRETSYVLPYLAEYHQEIPPHDFFDYAAWHGTVVPVYSDNMQMNRNLLISVLENYSQYIHAYTDGSKSEEGTGCAVLIPELDIEKKFKLPHIYSIFAAEAYAIYQALELLHAKYSQIVVLTDALSVIKAIRSNLPPISNINPIVGKIKSKLSRLRSGGKSVVIIWTKAHTGIFYNEAVDRAAKQAVFMSNFATQSVSIGDCINAIKMDVRKLWSEYYKAYCQNSTTQYCTIQRNIPPIPWYFNLRIPRKYITMYSRLRFGHGRFPAFLARIGMTDTNLCEECNVPGTIDHLFFECCKYRSQQNLLWNGLLSDGFMPPYNMLHLLALNDGRIQRRIICFLKQSSLVI
nr:unnamed protein product [Callosobruchus chinensis]